MAVNGHKVIELADRIHLKMDVTSEIPLNYNTANQVAEHCNSRGVPASRFAMDCTGAQNALADIIEREWQPGIYRVNFNGRASDNPVSSQDYSRPAKEAYINRVTELWHAFTVFANAGMIKNLDDGAIKEFIARKSLYKNKRRQAEPKKEMKPRVGYSPDIADAIVTGLALIKERMGVYPHGRGSGEPGNPHWEAWEKRLQNCQVEESYEG